MTSQRIQMRRRASTYALVIAVMGKVLSGRADITPSGDVAPANPSTWTSGTTGTIGNLADGSITVDNGSKLLSATGYLGSSAGVSGIVSITGTASSWITGGLLVGSSGAGTLNISSGGLVSSSGNSFLSVVGSASGSSGIVNVIGSGSKWIEFTGESLYLGYAGSATLNITSGGTVTSSNASVLGNLAGATGTVQVNGTGSAWSAQGLLVGMQGTGSLSITNGGTVTSAGSFFGYASGSNAFALIDGTNSIFTSAFTRIGYNGTGFVTVAHGGRVTVSTDTYLSGSPAVGGSSTGVANLTVDGTGSLWTTQNLFFGTFGQGILNITNGGVVNVSSTTTVSNGQASPSSINFGSNGGTLTTKSLYVSPSQVTGTGSFSTHGLVVDGSLVFDAGHGPKQTLLWTGSQQNVTISLDMSGGTSTLGDLGAGFVGTGTLTIQSATVSSADGYLGYASASNGSATATGTTSAWTLKNLYVGYAGTGSLTVNGGGKVNDTNAYLANSTTASGIALIDGSGSTWTTGSTLSVAQAGSGTLTISHGGKVIDGAATVGTSTGKGRVIVDGTGSTWASGTLSLGKNALLNLANGGSVSVSGSTFMSSGATIDFGTGGGTLSTGNLFPIVGQLVGTGSINTSGIVADGSLVFDSTHGANQTFFWNGSAQNITVHLNLTSTFGEVGPGYSGVGSFTVTSGVQIKSANGYLGYGPGSSGNVVIDGAGSSWIIGFNLYVGLNGAGGLTITNGGSVTASTANLGNGGNGTVLVNGAGSILTTSNGLNIGGSGKGSLTITGGGSVTSNGAAEIGGSGAGLVWLDGVGSSLSIKNYPLYIGYGRAGTMTITGGGKVDSGGGIYTYLGYQSGVTATVTLDGAGSQWSTATAFYVGYSSSATINVTNGGKLSSALHAYLGNNPGSAGVVTVDGPGSTWNLGDLQIGVGGTGHLNITNGGQVTVIGGTRLGNAGAGTINFGPNGGTLTTVSFTAQPSQIQGTGTINTRGLLLDGSLDCNSNQGVNQTLLWVGSSQNVSVHLDLTGSPVPGNTFAGGELAIGNNGAGSMIVREGISITSLHGFIGYGSGSTGVVSIDGPGSNWSLTDGALASFYVGYSGTGSLTISHGGKVTNGDYGYVGANSGAYGMVRVDGSGSTWTNVLPLTIGGSGTGVLVIGNGGYVQGQWVVVNTGSLVVMDVGNGSGLSASTGTLSNGGTFRLRAISNASVGTYTPLVAASWAGADSIMALGGSWNSTNHQVTISAPATGDTTSPITFDRSITQRLSITDSASGANLWEMVQAQTTSTLTLGASLMPAGQINPLQNQLTSSGSSVLKAWSITATGLSDNEPMGLAVGIGNGYLTQGLAIWQWNGTTWSAFNASDLSFGSGYANFTVTATGGYAVATIPLASTWNNSSGNWSDATKWFPAVPANNAPSGATYNAAINGGIVTLDADASINTLQLTGGTLTGAHTLTLLNGGTITGTYSMAGTTLLGGTLVLTSLSSYSGNLNNAGTVSFNNTGALSFAGSITGTGNLSQLGSGTTTLSKPISITGNLNISAGKLALTPDGASHSTPALDIGTLSITGTGTLDMKDRDAIIRNVPDPVAFANLITTGKITSSTATPGNGGQTLGYGLASQIGGIQGHGITTFDNTPVTANNMILKYTTPGDVTLDGSTDSFDLLAILNNFGTLYNGPTWWLGDVTGDGSVDSFDLLAVLNNFGNLVGGSFNPLDNAASDAQAITPAMNPTPSPVPEPASLTILTVCSTSLLLRRRPPKIKRLP